MGNIHVHIVINSVRKLDAEPQEFMERPCDSRAGYKHHQTRDYLTAMQKGIMEIAQREGLHQVDLLNPAPVKITEREYWKTRREQEKLDELDSRIIADGMKPRTTTYQTQKQFLRDAITDAASLSLSLEQFRTVLSEKYGITLKESRGRFSYAEKKKVERGKPDIPASSPDRQIAETQGMSSGAPLHNYDPAYDYYSDPVAILYVRSDLRLVIDLQTNIKAQQNTAYARKVKVSNLKEMAKTVCYIQEHGYNTRDHLSDALEDVSGKLTEARRALRATENRIKELNEQIHYVGQYQSRKPVQTQFLQARNKKKFRQEHQADLDLYEAGVKYIKENFSGRVPSLKALKTERDQLLQMKDAQYGTYHYFQDYQKELRTVVSNVDAILGKDHSRTQAREKAQDIS